MYNLLPFSFQNTLNISLDTYQGHTGSRWQSWNLSSFSRAFACDYCVTEGSCYHFLYEDLGMQVYHGAKQ